ncbi:MAG: metallophosphoesterase [Candidatus Accumulibacter sp.]|jgi:predicted MPP superfamily phosphohydrolase|nr:metallophosphoesterase [Accumulibacter sp.]
MFHVFSGLICLYIVFRLIPALPWPFAGKCAAALAVLLASQVHLLNRTFFGTLASPEAPFAVVAAVGWLFGALILLAVFLVLKDLGALLFFALGKATGVRLSLPIPATWWAGGLTVAALGLSAIGVWQAVRVPEVRAVDIVLDRLPVELDGLRLVQLSDLHASRLLAGPWQREVVDKANALEPDLILITGDLVDGTPADRAADVAPLRDLKARLGVLAVPGNHEYYSDYVAWMAAFDELGLRLLRNRHVVIRDQGQALVIAGTTDRNAARFGLPMPDIEAALAGAPKDAVVLLLAHQPREAMKNAEAGVDLQLSGHTHGGQIAGLHFIVQKMNEGFVSGPYRVGAMWLHVSNGTGLWNGFPVRLGRPSEITLITLRAASGKTARPPATRADRR